MIAPALIAGLSLLGAVLVEDAGPPRARFGLLGRGWRAAARIARHVDEMERNPQNDAAWQALKTELGQYRKKHPLVTWMLPRINRALGLSLQPNDLRVYLVPRKAWVDMEWVAGAQPGTIKAFYMEGDIYAPRGGAWASLLHEIVHLAGINYEIGLNPFLIEGLADVVSNRIGIPILERGWRTAYPHQAAYTRELSYRLGFKRPMHFASWLLKTHREEGNVLNALTSRLVKRYPYLSKRRVSADLAYSDTASPLDAPPYIEAWMRGEFDTPSVNR